MAAPDSPTPFDAWVPRLSGKPRADLRRALKWSEHLDALVNPTFVKEPDALKTHLRDPSGIEVDGNGHAGLAVAVEWTADDGTSKGREFGWAGFKLNGRTRVCDFDTLWLVKDEQRAGFGSRYLEVLIDLCRELGIERIDIDAQDDGRYVWARLGFAFKNDETRDDVVAAVKAFAEELGVEVPTDLDCVTSPSEIANLRGEVSFEAIARTGVPYSGEPGRTMPLGEALLLYAPYYVWLGTMDVIK